MPFPIAPLLARRGAPPSGCLVGLPALRLRGPDPRRRHLRASRTASRRSGSATPTSSTSFGSHRRSRRGLRHATSASASGRTSRACASGSCAWSCSSSSRSGVARCGASSLGSAMLAVRANERSAAGIGVNVVAREGRQLRDRVVHRRPRRLPARLPPGHHHLGVASPRSPASPCCRPPTSPAITSVFGGIQAGILAAGGIVFFAARPVVDLGGWFVVISGVLVIVTLIRNPEGLAAGGHELADTVADCAASARRRASTATGSASRPSAARPAAPRTSRRSRRRTRPSCSTSSDLTVATAASSRSTTSRSRVPPGGIVGLIGPNGAGKTSAIDAITGFAKADGRGRARRRVAIDGLPTAPAGAPRSRPHLPVARALRRPQRRGERERRAPSGVATGERARRGAPRARPRRHRRAARPRRRRPEPGRSASSCRSPGRARPTRSVAPARRAGRRSRHHRERVARRADPQHRRDRHRHPAHRPRRRARARTSATTSTCSTSARVIAEGDAAADPRRRRASPTRTSGTSHESTGRPQAA